MSGRGRGFSGALFYTETHAEKVSREPFSSVRTPERAGSREPAPRPPFGKRQERLSTRLEGSREPSSDEKRPLGSVKEASRDSGFPLPRAETSRNPVKTSRNPPESVPQKEQKRAETSRNDGFDGFEQKRQKEASLRLAVGRRLEAPSNRGQLLPLFGAETSRNEEKRDTFLSKRGSNPLGKSKVGDSRTGSGKEEKRQLFPPRGTPVSQRLEERETDKTVLKGAEKEAKRGQKRRF